MLQPLQPLSCVSCSPCMGALWPCWVCPGHMPGRGCGAVDVAGCMSGLFGLNLQGPLWTGRSSVCCGYGAVWRMGLVSGRLCGNHRVFGLLAASKDVAVRVSAEADMTTLQAELQFLLGDKEAKFRRATPGQRWWRFGPLRDAEMWCVRDLIARTGLVPMRDEMRTARAGPFRSFVYFAAAGTPSCMTLDDGSWTSTEAFLQPADPPPRRGTSGAALATKSAWGGPRRADTLQGLSQPAAAAGAPRVVVPSPAGKRTVVFGSETFPELPKTVAPSAQKLSRKARFGGTGQLAPPVAAADDRLDKLLARTDELVAQNAALLAELGHMRRENAELRRQLEALRGLQTHQPYAQPATPRSSGPLRPVVDIDMMAVSPEKEVRSPESKRPCTAPLGPPSLDDE